MTAQRLCVCVSVECCCYKLTCGGCGFAALLHVGGGSGDSDDDSEGNNGGGNGGSSSGSGSNGSGAYGRL